MCDGKLRWRLRRNAGLSASTWTIDGATIPIGVRQASKTSALFSFHFFIKDNRLCPDACEVEDSIPIPRRRLAFQLVAEQQGLDPREWLTGILGRGLANGLAIRVMIVWLFPSREPSPKNWRVMRFEATKARFHGEGVEI